MAGRKPIPTNLHILRGNPGKRQLNGDEPRFDPSPPKCPAHLSDEAKREWRRIVRELSKAKLLTVVDRAALAAYCQAWGRWVEAEENIRKHGTLVKSPNGYPMQSPYLAVANKAMEQMTRMLVEFGMSPSSRSRIKVGAGTGHDPQEDFLNGG
jgi:phage terminase, small subunit, putative, P27 family